MGQEQRTQSLVQKNKNEKQSPILGKLKLAQLYEQEQSYVQDFKSGRR